MQELDQEPIDGSYTLKVVVGAIMKMIVWDGVRHVWDRLRTGERLHLLEGCCRPTNKPIPTSTTGT